MDSAGGEPFTAVFKKIFGVKGSAPLVRLRMYRAGLDDVVCLVSQADEIFSVLNDQVEAGVV
jgi:hypothetical protein